MNRGTETRADSSNTLLHPTLQNRLRVIGYELDAGRFRDVAIFEIDAGFLARATAVDDKQPRALEFPDEQFSGRLKEAIEKRGSDHKFSSHSPLLPTGYEDCFRAIGYLLDRQSAFGVTIVELSDHILVTASEPVQSVGGRQVFRGLRALLRSWRHSVAPRRRVQSSRTCTARVVRHLLAADRSFFLPLMQMARIAATIALD